MKVTYSNAINLWNELCSPYGEQSTLTTTLGTVAISHNLVLRCSCSEHDLKNESDYYKRRQQEVRDIVQFLRDWADCIESGFKERDGNE